LLGTISLVLVHQHGGVPLSYAATWAGAALVGLVVGGLASRGSPLGVVAAALLDAALGAVLLLVHDGTLRALLPVLPVSDLELVGTVLTAIAAVLLGWSAVCVGAVPQALRYARWLNDAAEPLPAGSTERAFPPPPVPASRASAWRIPAAAPADARSRRRLYFVLAGFAIGFGAGIGVLASSREGPAASARAPVPPRPIVEPILDGGAARPSVASGAAAAPGAAGPPVIGRAGTEPTAGSAPGALGDASHHGPPTPVDDLIATQRAALARGDLDGVVSTLAPSVFGFGVAAAGVAVGRDAVAALLIADLGELVRDGADVDVRFAHVGEAAEHAWIALDLELAARSGASRRFAVTQLAAWTGSAWRVVAWHWAVPVADVVADRMHLLGTKPALAPIPVGALAPSGEAGGSAGDPLTALDAAVRAAFGSRAGFAAARSDHSRGFNFGSAPNERIVGGVAVARIFGRLRAELRLHDAIRITPASEWGPGRGEAVRVAYSASNVDFSTRTSAATEITHTFRVLGIWLREEAGWRLVSTQWSHGGPIR
jgi:hypothetical protein